MTYYLQAMRGFSDFRGRARRAEYWMFALVYLGIYLVAGTLDVVLGTTQLLGAPVLATVVALVHLVPAIALLVRRLHDTGRSGWWYFIGLVPLVGVVLLIVWLAADGEHRQNAWGDDPKRAERAPAQFVAPQAGPYGVPPQFR
ncbi:MULTISPECIES: DUF805 domain-containing protein [unclassified Pseudonocardia]|uniref:DUF805 domain-containing protein n=1 Tax=unclassified Pseudonocardia TaxID=2619320 RepID=UPI001CF662EF|nr:MULTISPECIES: DUF805 domain-containing protein [unclassified Pseudonocardia]